MLESGKDDSNDHETEEEAAAIGDGIDDGVFVEVAPRRHEPEAADPEEKDREQKPEAPGVLVEMGGVEGRDVKGEDDDGSIAAGGAEAAELFDVGYVVSAAAGGDATAVAEVFKFGETFDEGEREEEEDAEAAQPGGDGDSRCGGAGDDANGVEAGEDDDVDQDRTLETQGVRERGDEIDAEPQQEVVGLDEIQELGRQGGDGMGDKQRQCERGCEKKNDDDDAGEGREVA